MKTVGVLLAAGHSRRFGTADKLLASYHGRPLVSYAADALRSAGLDQLVAVVSSREVAAELPGFEPVWPRGPEVSLSASIGAGIDRADALGADRALIALGDMPGVTGTHLAQLVAKCSDDRPAATTDGTRPMAPACFPRGFFQRLLGLAGDAGARNLLADLPTLSVVPADAGELIDMDVRADIGSRPEELEMA